MGRTVEAVSCGRCTDPAPEHKSGLQWQPKSKEIRNQPFFVCGSGTDGKRRVLFCLCSLLCQRGSQECATSHQPCQECATSHLHGCPGCQQGTHKMMRSPTNPLEVKARVLRGLKLNGPTTQWEGRYCLEERAGGMVLPSVPDSISQKWLPTLAMHFCLKGDLDILPIM